MLIAESDRGAVAGDEELLPAVPVVGDGGGGGGEDAPFSGLIQQTEGRVGSAKGDTAIRQRSDIKDGAVGSSGIAVAAPAALGPAADGALPDTIELFLIHSPCKEKAAVGRPGNATQIADCHPADVGGEEQGEIPTGEDGDVGGIIIAGRYPATVRGEARCVGSAATGGFRFGDQAESPTRRFVQSQEAVIRGSQQSAITAPQAMVLPSGERATL